MNESLGWQSDAMEMRGSQSNSRTTDQAGSSSVKRARSFSLRLLTPVAIAPFCVDSGLGRSGCYHASAKIDSRVPRHSASTVAAAAAATLNAKTRRPHAPH